MMSSSQGASKNVPIAVICLATDTSCAIGIIGEHNVNCNDYGSTCLNMLQLVLVRSPTFLSHHLVHVINSFFIKCFLPIFIFCDLVMSKVALPYYI